MVNSKVCTQCGIEKGIEAFYQYKAKRRNGTIKNKRTGRCKDCMRARWRDQNKERWSDDDYRKQHKKLIQRRKDEKEKNLNGTSGPFCRVYPNKCNQCGKKYTSKTPTKICFSCRVENEMIQRRASIKKRKSVKKGASYAKKVVARNVFKRDNWRCVKCKQRVQKENIHADNAAEVDHIVPLSLGGPHTYSNVQTLCRKCNLEKGNSYSGQLKLAI